MTDKEAYYSLTDIFSTDIKILNTGDIPLLSKFSLISVEQLLREIKQSNDKCYLKPMKNNSQILFINENDLIFDIRCYNKIHENDIINHIYNACNIHNKLYLEYREETILNLLYKSHENLRTAMIAINETLEIIKDQQAIMCDIIDMKK